MTTPRLILTDGGAALAEDYSVCCGGWLITVPAGTPTDGASIPRFLWRVCGHPLEVPRIYAAVVHDWLYGGGGPESVTRADADGIYRALLVAHGFPAWRAAIEYAALRAFGGSHWTERRTGA